MNLTPPSRLLVLIAILSGSALLLSFTPAAAQESAKKPATDKPATNKPPTDKAPTDKAATDKAPAAKTDEAKTGQEKPDAETAAKESEGLPAGHSAHGEAFNEGPRQRAYLMEGTGKVRFKFTTKVPQAEMFCAQGLGQLYGFWYFEAERSFRQAAALDPECAMAYWGMAMANFYNGNRAKGFIKKAVEHKAKASRHEQLYIDAANAYLTGKGSAKDRYKALIGAIENIIHEFPDDIEAKAFLGLHMWSARRYLPIVSYEAIDALLREVHAVEPRHSCHHFRIHLWDAKKASRAVASAALCGPSAPGIAHMWHMPGHIYWRLQRYNDSAWSQEASARVDHAHMIRDSVMPFRIHNYAHNQEWCVRSLTRVARVHDAVDLAKNLIELPRHPKKNNPKTGGSAAAYGRARLMQVLERFELWEQVVALAETPYLEPTAIYAEQVKRLRLLGVAHFRLGNQAQAREQLTKLEQRHERLKSEQAAAGKKAEEKAKSNKKNDEKKVAKAKADAEKAFASRLKTSDAALAQLRGHAALAENNLEDAKKQFAAATNQLKEHRALLLVAAGDAKTAEELAKSASDSNRGQVHSSAAYVEVLFRAGKKKEAAEQFKVLRTMAANADLDAPPLARLGEVAKYLNLPQDWRLPQPARDDLGPRPDLDSLGPFRWHPTAAESWSLPGADGKNRSLADYRGKPVVVIFYLGYGCLHCVEQLQKFAPLRSKFAAAGIELVAIGTDDQQALRKSIESGPFKGNEPFPLLSDPEQTVFKKYRAFDDFENAPLHGTFLIDAAGLVRWHDISYEPYMEPDFLLDEAVRLLNQNIVTVAGE